MSIVVAVRKDERIVLAADTQSNFGSSRMTPDNHRAAKLHRVGTAWIGATGWGLYENLLQDHLAKRASVRLRDQRDIFTFFLGFWKALRKDYNLVNDQAVKDRESPFGDLDASFLVVNRQGIFCVESDLSVTRFERYFAIGSGGDFALGALHALAGTDLDAEELARRAVRAAIDLDSRCGGEIDVVRVK